MTAGLYDEKNILNFTGTTEGLLVLKKEPGLGENFFNFSFSNGLHVSEDFYMV